MDELAVELVNGAVRAPSVIKTPGKMALPPEQINIKRRREEEPVETLYIQTELHQKKRRFTDFIFQRVHTSDDRNAPRDAAALQSPRTAAIKSPRSVSSTVYPKRQTAGGSNGIPTVRATSPGAEFREERKLAAAKREAEEKRRRALASPPSLQPAADEKKDTAAPATTAPSDESPSPTVTSFPTTLRRFHISRTAGRSADGGSILKSSTGGISKRRDGSSPARAVLVEKLTRPPSLRGVSALETLERQKKEQGSEGATAEVDTLAQTAASPKKDAQRKRPVVNAAEKKWREEQKATADAAKKKLASKFDDDSDDLDRLARELEAVAMDLEREENAMDMRDDAPARTATTPKKPQLPKVPPPPLKYSPRPKPRGAGRVESPPSTAESGPAAEDKHESDSDDGDYVYDTYIRVPVRPGTGAPIATAITNSEADVTFASAGFPYGIDPTRRDVGVVVITAEDEELWDTFLEDEEGDNENWDGEDVDSNAEDNPANDYPDSELSSADEFDDTHAIYARYRHGASDDEQWDDEYDYYYGSWDEKRYGKGFNSRYGRGDTDDDDDDV